MGPGGIARLPADHRAPYDARAMLVCLLDAGSFDLDAVDLALMHRCMPSVYHWAPYPALTIALVEHPTPGGHAAR